MLSSARTCRARPYSQTTHCRSYAWVSVRDSRGLKNVWVFNNIVKFD